MRQTCAVVDHLINEVAIMQRISIPVFTPRSILWVVVFFSLLIAMGQVRADGASSEGAAARQSSTTAPVVEAEHVRRFEKGLVIVGNPADVGSDDS